MSTNTASVERALGSIGTTFRLVRLYPSTHPAVLEGLRQVATSLPGLQALGTIEWKVGATGLHWHGQQLLPRNAQIAELAGLLFARGVRSIQVHPGLTPEHVLALFNVATGSLAPDDSGLGRIALGVGRRLTHRTSLVPAMPSQPPASPAADEAVPGASSDEAPPPAGGSEPLGVVPTAMDAAAFRPEALPADVEARRALATLREGVPEEQREAIARLLELAGALVALRDTTAVAEVIAGLDDALPRVVERDVTEQMGAVAAALSDPTMVQRMVARLGEARVPPAEREALVKGVGALAAVTTGPMVEAMLSAPADRREPYRAAVRVAADRAMESLLERVGDERDEVVATVAEFLGLTGSAAALEPLLELTHHRAEIVRERALLALGELGTREVSRPCIPALKDESALVRIAAARTIGVAGDPAATTVLVRRLELEQDEGVHAEILRALGRLGSPDVLEVLAKWAEPGGRPRRTAFVRAAAVEGLGHLPGTEARALIELYRQDKDPAVKRAADAGAR